MTDNWQTVIALACVGLAAGVLFRRVWTFWHSQKSGCGGGCTGCGSSSTQETSMVSLTLPGSPKDKPH